MDKLMIKNKLHEIKPYLIEKYYVRRIGLFGSFVHNEQTENSDIDILVEFSKPIGLKFISLKRYLENMFSRKIDLATPNALKPPLKEKILNEVEYEE